VYFLQSCYVNPIIDTTEAVDVVIIKLVFDTINEVHAAAALMFYIVCYLRH